MYICNCICPYILPQTNPNTRWPTLFFFFFGRAYTLKFVVVVVVAYGVAALAIARKHTETKAYSRRSFVPVASLSCLRMTRPRCAYVCMYVYADVPLLPLFQFPIARTHAHSNGNRQQLSLSSLLPLAFTGPTIIQ